MSTTGISEPDLQQMVDIARAYGDAEGPALGEALPWHLLHDLKALVHCDLLSASGQDTARWEFFADQEVPGTSWSHRDLSSREAAYQAHYWDSPCSYPDRTGDVSSVHRISDLVPDAEHRRSGMYADYERPAGVEHELMVVLEAGGPQRTLRLLFSRGPGSDFSDRDVAVLTLLRPHLQAAYVTAERKRRGLLPLTRRQQEILRYVAAGYSNGQIARRLGISSATVGTHLENVFQRLQVSSRAAAVALVSPPL
jgi:DNA-binding CsgD family transcriptional regulator